MHHGDNHFRFLSGWCRDRHCASLRRLMQGLSNRCFSDTFKWSPMLTSGAASEAHARVAEARLKNARCVLVTVTM